MEKVGINNFILACWGIDDSGWRFRTMSDLWWEVVATSENLGKFRAVSMNSSDVEESLTNLLEDIKEAKNKC